MIGIIKTSASLCDCFFTGSRSRGSKDRAFCVYEIGIVKVATGLEIGGSSRCDIGETWTGYVYRIGYSSKIYSALTTGVAGLKTGWTDGAYSEDKGT